jgi:peptidoglycan-N-acetylglucosamine deacetylase
MRARTAKAGTTPSPWLATTRPVTMLLVFVLAAGCREALPDRTGDAPPDTAHADASHPGSAAPGPVAHLDLPAVAITVDDLPWVGPLPPGMTRLQATDSILAVLAAHGVQATGFVNCDRVQAGAPVLRRWLDAGHQLGNHTAGHLDLNAADPATWAADARTCDAFLRNLTGEESLPFRYPYLHRGQTAERYQAGRDVIAEMGSAIAPVTIETLDWVMDTRYVAALRANDDKRARAIADAYLQHIVRATRHYQGVAEERVGRDVAHIMLLHANALLAHQLDAMLTRLRQEGFRFISLDAALHDPVYGLPDDYLGRLGLSWLYRIPPAAPDAFEWDRAARDRLRALVR